MVRRLNECLLALNKARVGDLAFATVESAPTIRTSPHVKYPYMIKPLIFTLVLLFLAPIAFGAEPPKDAKPEPISIEALANSRQVITGQMQQVEAQYRGLDALKKQLDAEIERRVGEEKAKVKSTENQR